MIYLSPFHCSKAFAFQQSQTFHKRPVTEAAKQAAKATCFFDVGHAAFWLSRVGTSITQAGF